MMTPVPSRRRHRMTRDSAVRDTDGVARAAIVLQGHSPRELSSGEKWGWGRLKVGESVDRPLKGTRLMFSCHQCVREVIAAVDPPSSQQSRVDCIAPPRPQVRFTTVSRVPSPLPGRTAWR
jgi:hypothetical protein